MTSPESPFKDVIDRLAELIAECEESGDWSDLHCYDCGAWLGDTWMAVPPKSCDCECKCCAEPRTEGVCWKCGAREFTDEDAMLAHAWRKLHPEVKP